MSSAVDTDAMLRMRCETILLSIEKAYAERFFDLEPSVRHYMIRIFIDQKFYVRDVGRFIGGGDLSEVKTNSG